MRIIRIHGLPILFAPSSFVLHHGEAVVLHCRNLLDKGGATWRWYFACALRGCWLLVHGTKNGWLQLMSAASVRGLTDFALDCRDCYFLHCRGAVRWLQSKLGRVATCPLRAQHMSLPRHAPKENAIWAPTPKDSSVTRLPSRIRTVTPEQ